MYRLYLIKGFDNLYKFSNEKHTENSIKRLKYLIFRYLRTTTKSDENE